MIRIAICICTRNRLEQLKRLLQSLENLELVYETDVKIIIVENDSINQSENIVRTFSSRSQFRVNYFLEPSQGLTYARNRSVREAAGCDFCCFIDDDQIVEPNWLKELIKCQTEYDADGVWGPHPPIFDKEVPSYIKKYFEPVLFDYGDIVTAATTGGLLLRKKYLDMIEGPFDKRLNFTGGEDTYLTYLISKNGGVIRFNPKAIANEIVPNNRSTIKYIIKRTFKNYNEGCYIELLKNEDFSRLKIVPMVIINFILGLIITLPYFFFVKTDRLKGIIITSGALGEIFCILGKKNTFYK